MDQQFMFTQQNFNPYSDNRQFLKKVLTPSVLIPVVIFLGLMLAAVVYLAAFSFSADPPGLISSKGEQQLAQAETMARSVFFVVMGVVLLLPFIGTIIFVSSSKHAQLYYFFPRASLILYAIFLSICIAYASFKGLTAVLSVLSLLTSDSTTDYPGGALILSLIYTLTILAPAVITLIWCISGLAAIRAMKSAFDYEALKNRGLYLFNRSGIALGVINILLLFTYAINRLCGGLIYPDSSILFMVRYLASTKEKSTVAAVMTAVFLLAGSLSLFAVSHLVERYRRAVDSANKAIAMYGVNMYTNSDSTAAQYFQSVYTSPTVSDADVPPAQVSDIPPAPVSAAESSLPPLSPAGSTEDLPDEIVCPMCGEKNPPVCRFCNGCGNRLY